MVRGLNFRYLQTLIFDLLAVGTIQIGMDLDIDRTLLKGYYFIPFFEVLQADWVSDFFDLLIGTEARLLLQFLFH